MDQLSEEDLWEFKRYLLGKIGWYDRKRKEEELSSSDEIPADTFLSADGNSGADKGNKSEEKGKLDVIVIESSDDEAEQPVLQRNSSAVVECSEGEKEKREEGRMSGRTTDFSDDEEEELRFPRRRRKMVIGSSDEEEEEKRRFCEGKEERRGLSHGGDEENEFGDDESEEGTGSSHEEEEEGNGSSYKEDQFSGDVVETGFGDDESEEETRFSSQEEDVNGGEDAAEFSGTDEETAGFTHREAESGSGVEGGDETGFSCADEEEAGFVDERDGRTGSSHEEEEEGNGSSYKEDHFSGDVVALETGFGCRGEDGNGFISKEVEEGTGSSNDDDDDDEEGSGSISREEKENQVTDEDVAGTGFSFGEEEASGFDEKEAEEGTGSSSEDRKETEFKEKGESEISDEDEKIDFPRQKWIVLVVSSDDDEEEPEMAQNTSSSAVRNEKKKTSHQQRKTITISESSDDEKDADGNKETERKEEDDDDFLVGRKLLEYRDTNSESEEDVWVSALESLSVSKPEGKEGKEEKQEDAENFDKFSVSGRDSPIMVGCSDTESEEEAVFQPKSEKKRKHKRKSFWRLSSRATSPFELSPASIKSGFPENRESPESSDFRTPSNFPRIPFSPLTANGGQTKECFTAPKTFHRTESIPARTPFSTPYAGLRTPGSMVFKTPQSAVSEPTKYKRYKDSLVQDVFKIYNETVFSNKLPSDLQIGWNVRLTSTAGRCTYKMNENERTASIVLSTKIIDSYARLRDTLIHEMCHAATWIIDGTQHARHGPVWKHWVKKAEMVHPELPCISRCHTYEINKKFTYACQNARCYYTEGRFSKSMNLAKARCPVCGSSLALLPHVNKYGTPVPVRSNPFSAFVKENFSRVKKENPHFEMGEVMKTLSSLYKK